jgi:FixJ family two-component response regulator
MISIVDDELAVREASGCLVRSLGYDVTMFSSADEFLRSGRVETTECLISDINMPGLSGADLQDRLIAGGYRIPIIFVTAHQDEKLRGRVLRAGAIGFLSKPFDENRLIECLDAAFNLGNRKTAGQLTEMARRHPDVLPVAIDKNALRFHGRRGHLPARASIG